MHRTIRLGRSPGDRVPPARVGSSPAPRGVRRGTRSRSGRTTTRANVGFGRLVAHNDERLPPGTGYDDHPHADLEIVTWVLSGALRHTSTVGSGVIGPGRGAAALGRQRRGALRGGRRRRGDAVPAGLGAARRGRVSSRTTSRAEVTLGDGLDVRGGRRRGAAYPVALRAGTALHVGRPRRGQRLDLPDAAAAARLRRPRAGDARRAAVSRPGTPPGCVDEGGRALVTARDATPRSLVVGPA